MNVALAQNSLSQPTQQEKLIKGLLDTKDLGFVNHMLKLHGFTTGGRWLTVEANVQKDLNDTRRIKCNIATLELLVDMVITLSDHTYKIVNVSSSDISIIRKKLLSTQHSFTNSIYSNAYPMSVDFVTGNSYPEGQFLCKITEMCDGIASVICIVTKEKIPKTNQYKFEQTFHTVFIPNSIDRIEYRLSNKISPLKIKDTFTNLEQEFLNVVDVPGIMCSVEPLNFFSAIQSFFGDSLEGRVQQAVMTTTQDGDDAELNGKSRPSYCARKVAVSNHHNSHKYICRSLRLKYPYSEAGLLETELAIIPHKRDWDVKGCYSFSVKFPENSNVLLNMIEKVISRS